MLYLSLSITKRYLHSKTSWKATFLSRVDGKQDRWQFVYDDGARQVRATNRVLNKGFWRVDPNHKRKKIRGEMDG